MTDSVETPPPPSKAVRRGVRRSLAAALVLIAGAAGLAVPALLRVRETAHIRRLGVRQNALVVTSTGAFPAERVLVQFDVAAGGLRRVDVPAPAGRRYSPASTVRVAFDRTRPSRARILGAGDPIPAFEGAVALLLVVLAVGVVIAAARFARRARAAHASEPSAIMNASLWRARDGTTWARLEVPGAPDAPPWWVPLAPGQPTSTLDDLTMTVHGALASGWVVLRAGDVELYPAGRATAKPPRRVAPLDANGMIRGRRWYRTMLPAVATTVVLVGGTYALDGFVQRPLLTAAERRDAPACVSLDRVFAGRSALVDRSAPATVDQLALIHVPDALLSKAPAGIGFDGVPTTADTFMTLQQAAETRRDPAEGERVLRRYGYVGGYRRDWMSNGRLMSVFAYQFSSARNAQAFDVYANESVCPYGTETFNFPDLPGATGLRLRTATGGIAEQMSFVRGARRFVVGLTFGGPLPGHDDIHTLAAAALPHATG